MCDSKKFIQESVFPVYDAQEDPQEKAKKENYRQRLAEKLKDPTFRQIEGFPLGTDEAILALSDPPYYTACPNPFLDEILAEWQQERREIRKELGLPDDENLTENLSGYHREPFAADVSEGKNDPIYNAHSYHTKVPHKAIMRYILHYTDPGDIVFDGFCGTGMTGVAAQLCGDKKVVESLGYKVDQKGVIYEGEKPISRMGARKAVLNDLSPAATFIAFNYNTPVDARAFEKEAKHILKEVEEECGWMYETWHPHCDDPNRVKAKINYTVWSDVFRCPQCGKEMVFWDVAIDFKNHAILNSWECPTCGQLISKSPEKNSGALKVDRIFRTVFDKPLGKPIVQAKTIPVMINYSIGKKRFSKQPDAFDLSIINKVDKMNIENFYPVDMIVKGDKTSDPLSVGISNIHHFYTKRNLAVLAKFWSRLSLKLKWLATMFLSRNLTKCNRFIINKYNPKGRINGPLTGTFYIPSEQVEQSLFMLSNEKKIKASWKINKNVISTNSSTLISKTGEIFDYIFVDPPFGANFMYSELNMIWEAWLGVKTNNEPEAIINKEQRKNLKEYQQLMLNCFREFFRILKPGRWMTVEFHNSQNSVWNSIQEALHFSGFIVADVRTLDKIHGGLKAAFMSNTVKKDLIISAYKPTLDFEKNFKIEAGGPSGVWKFIDQHLDQLPMPLLHDLKIEVQGERMPYLLYDRMVAFHLVRGLTVPLSAAEFYQGLDQRYLVRDGMVFTPIQASRYDQLRMQAEKVQQLSLFVTDEASTIQWLRIELNPETGNGPQSYSEIMPRFLKQLHQERHEKIPELQEILSQNFIQGKDGCWQVPDPENAAHLEQLRERELLRDFNDYRKSKGRIKVFRSEAVRVGFSKAWGEHDYETIIQVAERLPEKALQEDPKLKLYYDNALNRAARQPKQERLI